MKFKENILDLNHTKKYIKICAWCDPNHIVHNKRERKGYTISSWMCKECWDKF